MPDKDVSFFDVFKKDTKYVSDEIQERRYSICMSCEHFRRTTKQCKKCGCFMTIKTSLANAECPAGKWLAEPI